MKRIHLSIYYLQELKYRMIYAAIGTVLLFFTTYQYKQALIFLILPQGLSHFITSGLTEIFFTYMQICTIISLSFGFVTIVIQIYLFLRPGLYFYESKIALNILVGTVLFYTYLYISVFPLLTKLLWAIFSTYSHNFTPIHLTFEPRLNDYLTHVQYLNKILCFSFPCIISLSLVLKYTNKNLWIKYRGISYIIAFSLAAFITPPDILSQTIVGFPIVLFYEIQIVFWTLYKEYQKQLLVR
uniref:SecY-independent protein translocase component tatC n=1 Tax=Scytosiphon lomentaria TaxID=27967 RepID=A0A0U1XCF3_SCYLO|nr:SecY-independent protein translocase component tatC [Scytosiphon lomentaria]AIQ78516.1 SecY-independent protein translocase component tatC [Scytosiphon lomentaria]